MAPDGWERYRIIDAKELPIIGLRATEVHELEPKTFPEPEQIPPFEAETLDDALSWLQSHERVTFAKDPATAEEIRALEEQLGRRLPLGLDAFFRRYHWLESRNINTFPIAELSAKKKLVTDYLEKRPSKRAKLVTASLPLVSLGNPLPMTDAVFLAPRGTFFWAALKELGAVDIEHLGTDFEAILLREIRSWYD